MFVVSVAVGVRVVLVAAAAGCCCVKWTQLAAFLVPSCRTSRATLIIIENHLLVKSNEMIVHKYGGNETEIESERETETATETRSC